MANYFIILVLVCSAFLAQAQTTVERLDQLDQSRVLLEKEIQVANLKAELDKANGDMGVRSSSSVGANLNLIKIAGLATKPEAVFLYGGYRIVADKGDMVIPNVQITSVNQSYVVLRDITSGKESVLWLSDASAEEKAAQEQF